MNVNFLKVTQPVFPRELCENSHQSGNGECKGQNLSKLFLLCIVMPEAISTRAVSGAITRQFSHSTQRLTLCACCLADEVQDEKIYFLVCPG